ncbi:MAG: tetratricopeptide repeat protein [Acidobacteriota bacterium]
MSSCSASSSAPSSASSSTALHVSRTARRDAVAAHALLPLWLAFCLALACAFLADVARGQASTDVNTLYADGVKALRDGRFDTAEEALRQVVAARPEWAGGHLVLGQVIARDGRAGDALTHFERAVELEPSDASSLALAQTALTAGRVERAHSALQTIDVASLDPRQRAAAHQLDALIAVRQGRLDAAIAGWRRALEVAPRDAQLHRQLGITCVKARHWDDAAAAFERTLDLDPHDAVAAHELVRARGELLGQVDTGARADACVEAWSAGRRLLELQRREIKPGTGVAVARFAACAGEPDTAASLLADFSAGSDPAAAFDLALAYALERRWNDVLGAVAPALEGSETASQPPRLLRLRGLAHEAREEWDDAIAAYRGAGDTAGVERVDTNRQLEERDRETQELLDMLEQLQDQATDMPSV